MVSNDEVDIIGDFFVWTKTVKIFFIIPSLVFHRRRKGIGIT